VRRMVETLGDHVIGRARMIEAACRQAAPPLTVVNRPWDTAVKIDVYIRLQWNMLLKQHSLYNFLQRCRVRVDAVRAGATHGRGSG